MKYKQKFYLLILTAIIYNLFQMMNHQKSSDKIIADHKQNESFIDLEHSDNFCPE